MCCFFREFVYFFVGIFLYSIVIVCLVVCLLLDVFFVRKGFERVLFTVLCLGFSVGFGLEKVFNKDRLNGGSDG